MPAPMNFGQALAAGLAQGTNNYVSRQDALDEQARQQGNIEADRQFRDSQFKYQRDSDVYKHLDDQRNEILQEYLKGAFAHDPLMNARAQSLLKTIDGLKGKVEKGQELTPEEQQGYDQMYQEFATVSSTGAGNLGQLAARQGEAATVSAENTAGLGQIELTKATQTLDGIIGATNAQNQFTERQLGVLESNLGLMGASQRADYIAKIAAGGDVGKAQLTQLQSAGIITPEEAAGGTKVAANAQTVNDAGAAQATNTVKLGDLQVQLTEKDLAKVKATYASTVATVLSTNDLTQATNAAQKGLLKLQSSAQQVQFLNQMAAAGGIGAQVVDGLVKSGDLDEDVAKAVQDRAGQVDQANTAQLDILLNQASISSDDRAFSNATLEKRTELFTSDTDLKLKENAAELDLMKFKTPAQRAAYLDGLSKMGAAGKSVIQGLVADGVLSQEQGDAFGAAADTTQKVTDTQLDILTNQAAITADDRKKADATLHAYISEFVSDASLKIKTDHAAAQLLGLQTAAQKGAYLDGLSKLGDAGRAIIQGLVSNGTITQQQGAAFGAAAGQAQDLTDATVSTAQSGATTAAVQAGVAPRLANAQVRAAEAGAAADESNARVAGLTEGARVSAANSGASTAASQATSAAAQAQVDVATIPDMIASRQVGVKQAQATLQSTLLENKFADRSFAGRIRALHLSNSKDVQTLLAMKQSYSQNAQKFPTELAYLKGQVAVIQAQAQNLIDGGSKSGAGGKGDVIKGLTQLRQITADELRVAKANLARVQDQYIHSAQFSVDKYDSKNFTLLVQNTSNLSPEAKQEIDQAQNALDAVLAKNNELGKALATVSTGGKLTPDQLSSFGIDPSANPSSYTPVSEQDGLAVSRQTSRLPGEKPFETMFLNGVYAAEGGQKASAPYGLVTEGKGKTEGAGRAILLDKLRRWMPQYQKATGDMPLKGGQLTPEFLTWFGNKYAPSGGVDNDPSNLNANWIPNVGGYMQAQGWNPSVDAPIKPPPQQPAPTQTTAPAAPAGTPQPAAQPVATTSSAPILGSKPLNPAAKAKVNAAIQTITTQLKNVGNDPTRKRAMLSGVAIPLAADLGRIGYQVTPAQVLELINSSGGQAF